MHKKGFTLTEGATHVAMPPVEHRRSWIDVIGAKVCSKVPTPAEEGFTLAEVLITLGIIGVVAAMTIPTLIANTRSQQYRSKFKKTVSTLSQAARMSQAQYGFDYAGIDKKCGTDAKSEHPDQVHTICALLNGTLTGATFFQNAADIKLNHKSKNKNYSFTRGPFLSGDGSRVIGNFSAYVLSDGTIVGIYKGLGEKNPCTLPIGKALSDIMATGGTAQCVGFIDVNGASLPNKEVSCSSGSDSISQNTCVVKNDTEHMTDIYPIRFHDGIVEPASAAARYVLKTAK